MFPSCRNNTESRDPGTAVYVYFILANFVGDNIPTQTVCDFALDGSYVSSFHHIPTSSTEFNYGALVFSKDNLSNEQHTLNISTSGLNELLWVCFDYATYTFDDTLAAVTQQQSNTPSTSSPSSSVTQQQSPTALTSSDNSRSATIGAIVGGTVGGISILANIVFILLCLRQRKHKSFPSSPAGNADETFTTQGLQPFSSIQGEQQAAVLIPRRPTLSSTTSNNEISSTSVMSMRQAEIEDQIRGLTREMQALAGEKNASIKRPLPIPPSSTYHNSHGERNYTDQIQKQMDTMRGEIEYLQAQLHSDWARGLTDNLPPGYHA
ncbi:hypothetical protein C0995_008356 [Termitomyces sp. Mi166|nr:hypothetical protein C0995_008356 [Termitomyces sp. Mi166\